jgi:AraC-like DNA-binding protein
LPILHEQSILISTNGFSNRKYFAEFCVLTGFNPVFMKFVFQMLVFSPMYIALFWAIVLLLFPGKKNRAKHFLGIFMGVAALLYFSHAVFFSHQHRLYLFIDSFYIFANLSVYPLYYWFLRLLTVDTDYRLNNLWHLVPAVLFSMLTALLYILMDDPLSYIQSELFKLDQIRSGDEALWTVQQTLYKIIRVSMFIQVVSYLYYGLKLIKVYEFRIKDFYSNLEGRSVDWARWLMIIFSVTAIMSSLANALGRAFFTERSVMVIVPALVFSTLIFIIGYLGQLQSHTVYDLSIDEEKEPLIIFRNRGGQSAKHDAEDSRLFLIPLKKQLLTLFDDEKIYRQHDLKITHISQILNTNRTYVSKLINEEFGCPFSDYVNRYRIDEVKYLMGQDGGGLFTLEHLAEKSGFTSAASLIRVFKQLEGTTPGAYREKLQLK